MTTPALKSLNVSSLNHHHTYKPASRPGLQGILWILNSYSSYSAMLKMKFRKENRTKSGFTFLKMICWEEAPFRILWDCKFLKYGVNTDKTPNITVGGRGAHLISLDYPSANDASVWCTAITCVQIYLAIYLAFITLFRATTSPYIYYTYQGWAIG